MKSLSITLGVALALSGTALAATAADAPKTAPKAPPAWVAESDKNAQILLKTFADFAPEGAGQIGVDGLDDQATNLTPDFVQRLNAALDADVAQFQALLTKTTEPHVKQDLQILIDAANNNKRDNQLQAKYLLNFTDVPQLIFGGVRALVDPQIPLERQQAVVKRMQAYAGMLANRPAITEQGKAMFEADLKRDPSCSDPTRPRSRRTWRTSRSTSPASRRSSPTARSPAGSRPTPSSRPR
jgi:hypothetical protein